MANKLNTILIDDEKNSLEVLRMMIEKYCRDLNILALCQTPEDGIGAIRQHQPDLVFLDIQMPDMNGFDLLKALGNVDFEVIFVTAFDTYSMQAIKVSALDYLLKPVDKKELLAAVGRVRETLELKRTKDQVDFLLAKSSTWL